MVAVEFGGGGGGGFGAGAPQRQGMTAAQIRALPVVMYEDTTAAAPTAPGGSGRGGGAAQQQQLVEEGEGEGECDSLPSPQGGHSGRRCRHGASPASPPHTHHHH